MTIPVKASLRAAAVLLVLIVSLSGLGIIPVHAATKTALDPPCSDTLCIGLNPQGICDSDAITIATMTVADVAGAWGQLDLRYSKSCQAAWGRFTIFQGPRFWYLTARGQSTPVHGRVTAWSPGLPSEGTVQSFSGTLTGTTWSYMVDGTMPACVGVEVVMRGQTSSDETGWSAEPDDYSEGWFWGPCST